MTPICQRVRSLPIFRITWLPDEAQWAGLKAIGMVKSKHMIQGEESIERRYYITSLTKVEQFADAMRKHWSIENQLHWCLDVYLQGRCRPSAEGRISVELECFTQGSIGTMQKCRIWQACQSAEAALLGLP